MNKKMIPLTYDREFVSIFSNPDNMIIIERMISILLKMDINDVRGNLKIMSRNLKMQNNKARQSQIDLLLDYKGKKINIELQRYYSEAIKERNLVYASKIQGEELKQGETYSEIESFIQIVLNDDKKYMNEVFIEKIELINEETHKIYSDKFKIIVINLLNYKKSCYNEDEEIVNFSKILLANDYEELASSLSRITMDEKEKKLLEENVEDFSEDEDEYAFYMDRSKEKLEYEAVMKDRLNEDREEGIKKSSIEIAKKLLDKDAEVDLVIEVTGLSKEEVLALKN